MHSAIKLFTFVPQVQENMWVIKEIDNKLSFLNQKNLFLICILFFFCYQHITLAQEMRAVVKIDAQRVNQDNSIFFKQLQEKIANLINQTNWSPDDFAPVERIESTWLFTLTRYDPEAGLISGTLQINTQRPIFRTTYSSALGLLVDDQVYFNYWEEDFLEYQDGMRNTNLVSLLAFYCYVILGFDYDSFASLSGTWAYQKAQEIFLTSQYVGVRGWENRSLRYGYVDQFDVGAYRDFRQILYDYHRLGLDRITQEPHQTRQTIIEALENLKKITQEFNYFKLIYNFTQNKEQEIVQLFENSSRQEKDLVYQLMKILDFKRLKNYEVLLK